MIYWHVEQKSLNIHSQLKSPASSEVASMIEGVVRHCTEMEIDPQYKSIASMLTPTARAPLRSAFAGCSASNSCRV